MAAKKIKKPAPSAEPPAQAPPAKLHTFEERQVAAQAMCDPRSVHRYLNGARLQPMMTARIERALREMGLGQHVRRVAIETKET